MHLSYRWQLVACLRSMVSAQTPTALTTQFPLQTHADIQRTHHQDLAPACDAKQQHAVALLTSPAGTATNLSSFFLRMLLIRTQRRPAEGCSGGAQICPRRRVLQHIHGCLHRAVSDRCICSSFLSIILRQTDDSAPAAFPRRNVAARRALVLTLIHRDII